jgi:hypothetical protein
MTSHKVGTKETKYKATLLVNNWRGLKWEVCRACRSERGITQKGNPRAKNTKLIACGLGPPSPSPTPTAFPLPDHNMAPHESVSHDTYSIEAEWTT